MPAPTLDPATAQGEYIEPARMPLTRLANTIIDGVAAARGQVAAEIRKYLASDLIFYRAETPAAFRARQAQHWDPIVAWARQALGADFKLGSGVVHVVQPAAALDAAAAAIPHDAIPRDAILENDWRLGAVPQWIREREAESERLRREFRAQRPKRRRAELPGLSLLIAHARRAAGLELDT